MPLKDKCITKKETMWVWELLTEPTSMKHALNNLLKLCLNDTTFDEINDLLGDAFNEKRDLNQTINDLMIFGLGYLQ